MQRGWRYIPLALAATLLACASGDSPTSTSSSTSSSGGGGQVGGGGAGGDGGEGATGGSGVGGSGGAAGGGGGGTVADYGPPASDFVSSGNVSESSSYKLVWTMGQSTSNQSTSTSPSYRLQGGLVGANGSVQ